MTLTTLAREGLYSRRAIKELNADIDIWKARFYKAANLFKTLHEETREMRVTLRILPEKIRGVVSRIFPHNQVRAEKEMRFDVLRVDAEIKRMSAAKALRCKKDERLLW
jgi:ACT domain-containing protein